MEGGGNEVENDVWNLVKLPPGKKLVGSCHAPPAAPRLAVDLNRTRSK